MVRLVGRPVALVTLLSAGCGAAPVETMWPDETWAVTTPEDAGFDAAALDEVRAWVMQPDEHTTQAVVVVKDGRIVSEWYDEGRTPDDLATTWSMAKSLASVLVGIAIDRGELGGLDTTFGDVFPAWATDERATIDLGTLLSMRSGLAWGQAPNVEFVLFLTSPDQLAPSVDRALEAPPGTRWKYASGDAMLVGGILEAATGVPLTTYAQDHLFGPLGMTASWWTDVDGHALTYCCVDATPRDLARFGLMAARGGAWKDDRIVSEAWLDTTTKPQADAFWYGMLWWTYLTDVVVDGEAVPSFVADGLGNERIYVFPTLDLVIVRATRYSRTGDGHVRSGTVMPITPSPNAEVWSDGDFVGGILRALDPAATVGPVCRDEETGDCGGI